MLYIDRAKCNLDVSGTTANVDCSVSGNADSATKAKIVAELQIQRRRMTLGTKYIIINLEGFLCEEICYNNWHIVDFRSSAIAATSSEWEYSVDSTSGGYNSNYPPYSLLECDVRVAGMTAYRTVEVICELLFT